MSTYQTCAEFIREPTTERLLAAVQELDNCKDGKSFNDLVHWIERRLFTCEGLDAEAVYRSMWPRYYKVVERARKELGEVEYDPNGPILVIVPTFISSIHAPSRAALELCLGLEGEVYMLDAGSFPLDFEQPDLPMPFSANRYPNPKGAGMYPHGPQRIPLVSTAMVTYDQRISQAVKFLQSCKPSAIFSQQSWNFVADVAASSVPTVYVPTSTNWPMTCAHVHMYPKRSGGHTWKVEALEGQHIGEWPYEWIDNSCPKPNKITKTDLGIDEDAIVLAVVGNRLNTDVTPEYQKTLRNILDKCPGALLTVVGLCEPEPWPLGTRFLGHRKDLIDVLSCVDIYLNPDRKGGGQTSYLAASLGKPIITYNKGDVGSMFGFIHANPGDSTEYEALAVKAATDARERTRLGQTAQAVAESFPLLRDSTKELNAVMGYAERMLNSTPIDVIRAEYERNWDGPSGGS